MDIIYGVSRKPHGLSALLSRRAPSFASFSFDAPALPLPSDPHFTYLEVPLQSTNYKSDSLYSELQASWQRLESAKQMNAAVAADILFIVSNTVLHPSSSPAANISFTNFCARLCNRAALKELLEETIPHRKLAMRSFMERARRLNIRRDTLLVFLHDKIFRSKLPEKFTATLLPALRSRPINEITEALGYYYALDLDINAQMLAAVLRFACRAPRQLPQIFNLLSSQSVEHRLLLALLLLRTDLSDHSTWINKLEKGIDSLDPEEAHYTNRLSRLIQAMDNGSSIEYVLSGYEIADRISYDFHFQEIVGKTCAEFSKVESLVRVLNPHLADRPLICAFGRDALKIWADCGALNGLSRVIEEIEWSTVNRNRAEDFYNMFAFFRDYQRQAPYAPIAWALLLDSASWLFEELKKIPEAHQDRWLHSIRAIVLDDRDRKELQFLLYNLLPLVNRLSLPPIEAHPSSINIFDLLLEKSPGSVERLQNFSDGVLKQVSDFSFTANHRELMCHGLIAVLPAMSNFLISALEQNPTKTLRIIRALGTIADHEIQMLLSSFQSHKLNTALLEWASPAQLHEYFREETDLSFENPVPKKLIEHLEGKRQLSKIQIAKCMEKFESKLTLAKLQVLESLILRFLARDQASECDFENPSIHAAQMVRWRWSKPENQRAFKKFFSSLLDGDKNYLYNHPASREWLKKHPEIKPELLQKGLKLEATIAGVPVTLEIEMDPLEVLKMGTYVGTCLGLGGHFCYSAFANVIDINKQVVYARNVNGTVIGRQLLAISQQRELVCFSPYPLNLKADLSALFRQFDIVYAEFLGIRIHGFSPETTDSEDDDYYIEHILSSEWHNDMEWYKLGEDTSPEPPKSVGTGSRKKTNAVS